MTGMWQTIHLTLSVRSPALDRRPNNGPVMIAVVAYMNINSSLVSMRREDGVIGRQLLLEMLLPPGLSSLVFVLLVSPTPYHSFGGYSISSVVYVKSVVF